MVIDSCIFIDHLRAKEKSQTNLYKLLSNNKQLFISTITAYELFMGATSEEKATDVKLIIAPFQVLPFDMEASVESAKIYHKLRKENKLIDFRDIFIAATCIVFNKPLVTNNTKHFARIEELVLYV